MLRGNPANNAVSVGSPDHQDNTSLFEDCLEFMLGPKQEGNEICEAARSEYLREIHQYRIGKDQLAETIQVIVQFGIRFDLLDQTILQAITYFECYLAKNANAMPFFLREIAIIAVEIAIKNNEDKVLSLEECVYMIDKIGVSTSADPNADPNTS